MDKLCVLETMSQIQALADNEETGLTDFLPLKSYENLRDPQRFLVLGGRGSGKTRIFRTLLEKDGFEQVVGAKKHLSWPRGDNTVFIAGYREGNDFPNRSIMELYKDEKQAVAFWAGSIVFLLFDYYKDESAVLSLEEKYFSDKILPIFRDIKKLKSPGAWISYILETPEAWANFLDDVDDHIKESGNWVIFAYDSLDRICERYIDLFPYIRQLLSFWYSGTKRWSRIRCKIFLRSDLYDSQLLSFPDSSKMSGNRLILEWNTLSLYRLLIRRMANADDNEDAISYLQMTDGLIMEEKDSKLGYIPTENESIVIEFVDGLIGRYMGSSAKKGISYTWAPNHLQDTHGILSPRSFLKCFSAAAEKMCEKPETVMALPGNRLLTPSMIQESVQEVSSDRVQELQEEYPWLEELKQAFSGMTLLVDKNEMIAQIQMNLWSGEKKKQLPATTPVGIFETLEKLGIVFVAKDGRVNVPEIYLLGFGMKRKGGIRRPS